MRDLVAEGDTAVREADDVAAALKSTAGMVDAIETAVRWYEEPPTEPLLVETEWADVTLRRRDWAEAFAAPEAGMPHNEARGAIWQYLAETVRRRIGNDDLDLDDVQESLRRNDSLAAAVGRAWPMLDATDLVGDLWSVPAFLRMCAPWLAPDDVRRLQRERPDAWTLSLIHI